MNTTVSSWVRTAVALVTLCCGAAAANTPPVSESATSAMAAPQDVRPPAQELDVKTSCAVVGSAYTCVP